MAVLSNVCVVIPFYQKEGGILRRALASILGQVLPQGVRVQVIVVDDGSPAPVAAEVAGLVFEGAFSLRVIAQANGGVGVARNTALAAVPADTEVLAFLDSDDTWLPGHLAKGLAALRQGYDFYFCDNAREGHHASHFVADAGLIAPYIEKAADRTLIEISPRALSSLILRDFPCQMSTVLFRYAIAPALRFDTSFKHAGEDVVFFLHVVAGAGRACFSAECMVQCGKGINLYFSNMGWGCPGYLKRLLDDTRAHEMLGASPLLSAEDKAWNAAYVRGHKRQVVFFTLRYLVKHRALPPEIKALARADKALPWWFAREGLYVVAGRMLGFYKPF